jgi:hypothetical protein
MIFPRVTGSRLEKAPAKEIPLVVWGAKKAIVKSAVLAILCS